MVRQSAAAPREIGGNRQDSQRAGGENPKRGRRPSLCRFRVEGFLKGRRGIETLSPLMRAFGTFLAQEKYRTFQR